MADSELRLPGEDLVEQGLADLAAGVPSEAAALVEIGAPRLRRLGFVVRDCGDAVPPERRLYQRIAARHPRDAHSRYNALVRRLISFERALEFRRARERRLSQP